MRAVFISLGTFILAPAVQAATCPSDLTLSDRVAYSTAIFVGTPEVPQAAVEFKETDERRDYVAIPFHSLQAIKGRPPEGVLIWHYPGYGVSSDQLRAVNGRSSLVFAVQRGSSTPRAYFSDPEAVYPADPASVAVVEAEVARQTEILSTWKPNLNLPHSKVVGRLINELAGIRKSRGASDKQQMIFAQLEALGQPAVPAIIAQMDDRRPLAVNDMSLINYSPDAFEGIRHYGPELVVDALAAILNQITSHSYGFIYNGATDWERDQEVAGWHVYAANLACAPAAN